MTEEKKENSPVDAFAPEGASDIDPVIELALDLRWSRHHAAAALWKRIEPALWELTHNPWTVCRARHARISERPWPTPACAPLSTGFSKTGAGGRSPCLVPSRTTPVPPLAV